MSVAIIGIALLHAIPVVLVGVITKSKTRIVITALISAIIGVAWGNPAFISADLIGVFVGYSLGSLFVTKEKPVYASPSNTREASHTYNLAQLRGQESEKKSKAFWAAVVVIPFLAYGALMLWGEKVVEPARSSLPGRLEALASNLQNKAPGGFGDNINLVHAWGQENSLNLALSYRNYNAADINAKRLASNFKRDLSGYYCPSQFYVSLLNDGATIRVFFIQQGCQSGREI